MTEGNTGGIASKLGNTYEAKWLVRQLLDVAYGRTQSLKFEGISTQFVGFEAALQKGAITEWHQTKINAPHGNWTVPALEREGVLSAFARRLSGSATNRCVFVSQDSARDAGAMSDKARRANDVGEFISSLGKKEREAYDKLRDSWAVTDATMQIWLSRCSFLTVPISEIDSYIETIGSLLLDGNQLFGALRVYLEERFNKLLTTESVRQELFHYNGVKLKHWQLDPTLIERIKTENDAYLAGHGVLCFKQNRIERRETKALVELLTQDSGPAVVLLSGVAGAGKSGVVCELIDVLRGQGIHHLVFRVDHHLDAGSPQQLGLALTGRQESPAVTLKGLAPDQPAVLIVDQVDAVSDAAGRSGTAKEAVLRLVHSVAALESVKIVLVCRTFDLGGDARFKQLKENDKIAKLEVQLLDWATEIEPLVRSFNINVAVLTASQRELLRLPLNLGLFLELSGEGGSFASRGDLFEALLQRKDRAIRQQRTVAWSIYQALGGAADWMSAQQRLDCPVAILDTYAGASDILMSEHLIISSRESKFGFFHESLFDHLYARQFTTQARSLHAMLTSPGSEQHLFRRTQVRQILEVLRQSDRSRYLQELKEVLQSAQIRFHVKHAIALWLGTIPDPTREELRIVAELDDGGERLPQLIKLALLGSSAWFDVLRQDGWIERELDRANGDRLNSILHWLTSRIGGRPVEIVKLLKAWWGGNQQRGRDLLRWLGFVKEAGDEAITELCEILIRTCYCDSPLDRHDLILRNAVSWGPTSGVRILRALSEAWFAAHPAQHPFERDMARDIDLFPLEEFAQKSAVGFLEGATPMLVRSIEVINEREKAGRRDFTFSWLRLDEDALGVDKLIALYRTSLRRVATEAPEEAKRLLAAFDPRSHRFLLHLYLETIAASNGALADTLIPLLDLEVADAGWEGARWKSFADAVRASLLHLSEEDRNGIEDFILKMQPEIQQAVKMSRSIKEREADSWPRPKNVIHRLNVSGEIRWAILETIGADMLAPRAVAVLKEGRRKFQGRTMPTPNEISFGWTQSPIAQDRVAQMSDDHWLRAMEKHATDDGRFRRDHGGGARELASELQNQAKNHPPRFTVLLARIPDSANPIYVDYILRGLAEATEPDAALLAEAIRLANGRPGRHHDEAIVRLFRQCPTLAGEPALLDLLLWIGEHGAANESDTFNSGATEQELITIEDLVSKGSRLHISGINGARGAAAEALAAVLWKVPSAIDPAWSFLERRIAEEAQVSVRCCLVRPLLPLFNSDKARCGATLERLIREERPPTGKETEKDISVAPLATHAAIQLLPYIVWQVPEIGRRLLERLLKSRNETFRLIGAWHVLNASYSDASYASLADEIAQHGARQRRLAAAVAADAAVHEEFRDRAERELMKYFDDEDRETRAQAAGVFREIRGRDFREYRRLAEGYVASKAFDAELGSFLDLLESGAGDVQDLVVAAAERVMADLAQNGTAQGRRTSELYTLQDLIRRDYAATENNVELRARLLDVIDAMVAGNHYGAETIVQNHDR